MKFESAFPVCFLTQVNISVQS